VAKLLTGSEKVRWVQNVIDIRYQLTKYAGDSRCMPLEDKVQCF